MYTGQIIQTRYYGAPHDLGRFGNARLKSRLTPCASCTAAVVLLGWHWRRR